MGMAMTMAMTTMATGMTMAAGKPKPRKNAAELSLRRA
jgi:hypothetical protein